MSKTKKKSITTEEYYQLEGLMIIAKQHNDALKVLEQATIDITGENTEVWGGGHCGDAVYSDMDAKLLLRRLGLEIQEQADD